jgi:hypothetical protein
MLWIFSRKLHPKFQEMNPKFISIVENEPTIPYRQSAQFTSKVYPLIG